MRARLLSLGPGADEIMHHATARLVGAEVEQARDDDAGRDQPPARREVPEGVQLRRLEQRRGAAGVRVAGPPFDTSIDLTPLLYPLIIIGPGERETRSGGDQGLPMPRQQSL